MTSQKIRVAQVITRLDKGGAPEIFRILCARLDPAIYDVTIVAGRTKDPSERTRQFMGHFKSRTVLVPPLKPEINIFDDMKALWSLYRLFRRERFDIIHTHTAKAGALGRLAAFLAGGSIVIHTPHGHNFYGYFGDKGSRAVIRAERLLARITDRIVALTELEKADNIKYGSVSARKIEVIRQGLELDKYAADHRETSRARAALGIKPGDPVVGMVGRLEPVKGSAFFIEAAARVAKDFPAARFIVVGDGSLRGEMAARAGSLGIGKRVIFTGWRDDAQALLPLMDVMVMPSLNEAVGMALVEAQARGVSVVASRVGGIPEVVRDGRTGMLVPPSDPGKIAEAVCALLADAKRRAEMGASGRRWVFNRFRAEDMVDKTAHLYLELLHRRR